MMKKPCNHAENSASAQRQDENGSGSATTMESDGNLVEVDRLNVRKSSKHAMSCFGLSHNSNGQCSTDQI